MRIPAVGGAIVLVVLGWAALAVDGNAQEKKKAPIPKRQPNPAMAPIEDQPGLPRVLLIGDSISIGYTLPVREALTGKANVHRPKDNCGPTIRGLEKLEDWLGKGKWDVIHFNFGLHDLKFMPDGKQQVPLADYEKNLRELVGQLKKTGATLIWCATTPVPHQSNPLRKNDDVMAYNAVAKKIMDENHIRIDDLYGFALPQIKEIQLPNNVHYSAEGSKVLAQQVSRTILEVLPKK